MRTSYNDEVKDNSCQESNCAKYKADVHHHFMYCYRDKSFCDRISTIRDGMSFSVILFGIFMMSKEKQINIKEENSYERIN